MPGWWDRRESGGITRECGERKDGKESIELKKSLFKICLLFLLSQLIFFLPLPSLYHPLTQLSLQQNQIVLEGLAHIQHQSGVPLSGISTWGDLTLNQRHALPSSGIHSIYDTPAFPPTVSSAADWRPDSILAEYWERNSKWKAMHSLESAFNIHCIDLVSV